MFALYLFLSAAASVTVDYPDVVTYCRRPFFRAVYESSAARNFPLFNRWRNEARVHLAKRRVVNQNGAIFVSQI